MTELVPTTPGTDIAAQMQWAQAVTMSPERGGQSILPESYRNNPANVLIAVGLGQAMGLSFAESLYRISVIKGKPSAAAELIAANVRKAGHKLRVKVSENPPSATCTIIRADDPDEPTVITRDMDWAQKMGLAGEVNYKKQPATMLSYRAITACARLACPEALYGVTYTPDEAASFDDSPAPAQNVKAPGLAGLRAAVQPTEPAPVADVSDAEVLEDEPEEMLTARTRGAVFALMTEAGVTDEDAQRRFLSDTIGHQIASRSELTEADGKAAEARLRAWKSGNTDAAWVDAEAGA